MKVLTVRRCKFRSEQAATCGDTYLGFFWKFFEVSMIAESSRQKKRLGKRKKEKEKQKNDGMGVYGLFFCGYVYVGYFSSIVFALV